MTPPGKAIHTHDGMFLAFVAPAGPLRGTDLVGAALVDAALSGADLRGADLRGADLSGADLRGADLRGAELYGTILVGAILVGADLRGTDLTGADLSSADLAGARLDGAEIFDASLSGANLTGASLYGAELSGADLTDADYTADEEIGARGLPGADSIPEDALACVRRLLCSTDAVKRGATDWLDTPRAWSSHALALRRHLAAWDKHRDFDTDSTHETLAHVAGRALMLLTYQIRGIGQDDRS